MSNSAQFDKGFIEYIKSLGFSVNTTRHDNESVVDPVLLEGASLEFHGQMKLMQEHLRSGDLPKTSGRPLPAWARLSSPESLSLLSPAIDLSQPIASESPKVMAREHTGLPESQSRTYSKSPYRMQARNS